MAAASTSPLPRSALAIMAVVAAGAALYWLADILTPLALAVFLAVMIDGFARVLRKRLPGLSKRAALPVALVLSILMFIGAAFIIADNATAFVSQMGGYAPKLNARIAQVAGIVGVDVPPTVGDLFHRLNPSRYLADVARSLQGFASDAVFVLIYLGFIMASQSAFERKVVGLFPHRSERQEATDAFRRIRDGVEQYLWVQTVTGLMIAAGSWIAMAAIGLDSAVFWAFLIFIASYIPIVGGIVGVAAPPIFALVQFEHFGWAIGLFAILQAIQFVVGNVVQPRMQGRSLNMDPVVVLLSLAFWGKIWGLAGMFLSTPLTVMAMVILAQFEGTRWLAVLLSADGEPEKLKAWPPNSDPDEPPDAPAPEGRRKTDGRPST